MKYLHIVPGADDVANGMVRVARLLAAEQGDAVVVDLDQAREWLGGRSWGCLNHGIHGRHGKGGDGFEFGEVEEVWVHGMWLPKEWAVCRRVLRAGKRLVRMTHGSLSPVYLTQQGRWKKWLVGSIERWLLRRCERIVATCEAEKEWIEAYVGKGCPRVEVTDVKRFFDLNHGIHGTHGKGEGGLEFRVESLELVEGRRERREDIKHHCSTSTSNFDSNKLRLLYLGRRHPLKGVEYLERAVKELNHGIHGTHGKGEDSLELGVSEENSKLETRNLELKIVSNAFGEEKEKVWEWCDVLILPTLSENFGLVVAEALERGKRVITTDGAPAWACIGDCCQSSFVSGDEFRVQSLAGEESNGSLTYGYGGRLIYLRGYRDGTKEQRVELLKKAIEVCRR